jgi:MerR family copper efflux transcriptional regulator
MRVDELARRSGISASTLRHYEKLGLLRPASRSGSGYREYTEETLDQLALIHRAKELGFSLREIRALLTGPRGASRESVLAAVASKLTELERERKSLGSKERKLRDLRGRVQRDGDMGTGGLTRWLLRPDREEIIVLDRSSLGHFDETAFRVISAAADEAERYQHNWIGSEHLLLAFAQQPDDAIRVTFDAEGIGIVGVRRAFETIDFGATTGEAGIFITHRVERIFGIAEGLALSGDRRATAQDLLLAILEDGGGVAIALIRTCGGDPARVAATLRERLV